MTTSFKKFALLLGFMALLTPGFASADGVGLMLGGGGTYAQIDDDFDIDDIEDLESIFDDKSFGLNAGIGWRFNKWIAVDGGYWDLGEFKSDRDGEGRKAKLDFDAFAVLCTPEFDSLVDGRAKEGLVRVHAVRDTYYNEWFGKESEWTCYALSYPDNPVILYGYSKKGTAADDAMEAIHQRVLRHTDGGDMNRTSDDKITTLEMTRTLAKGAKTRTTLMIGEMVSVGATLGEAIAASLQTTKETLESVLISLHMEKSYTEKGDSEYLLFTKEVLSTENEESFGENLLRSNPV